MKALIGIAILLVSLFGGTILFKDIHDTVRKAALEKAAHGLPSLMQMNRALRASPKVKKLKKVKSGNSSATHGGDRNE